MDPGHKARKDPSDNGDLDFQAVCPAPCRLYYVLSCGIPFMPVMYQVVGFGWGDGRGESTAANRVATGGA